MGQWEGVSNEMRQRRLRGACGASEVLLAKWMWGTQGASEWMLVTGRISRWRNIECGPAPLGNKGLPFQAGAISAWPWGGRVNEVCNIA